MEQATKIMVTDSMRTLLAATIVHRRTVDVVDAEDAEAVEGAVGEADVVVVVVVEIVMEITAMAMTLKEEIIIPATILVWIR